MIDSTICQVWNSSLPNVTLFGVVEIERHLPLKLLSAVSAVQYYCAVSLDGFIAGTGTVGWTDLPAGG